MSGGTYYLVRSADRPLHVTRWEANRDLPDATSPISEVGQVYNRVGMEVVAAVAYEGRGGVIAHASRGRDGQTAAEVWASAMATASEAGSVCPACHVDITLKPARSEDGGWSLVADHPDGPCPLEPVDGEA